MPTTVKTHSAALLRAAKELAGCLEPRALVEQLREFVRDVPDARVAGVELFDEQRECADRYSIRLDVGEAPVRVESVPLRESEWARTEEAGPGLTLAVAGMDERDGAAPRWGDGLRSLLGVTTRMNRRRTGAMFVGRTTASALPTEEIDYLVELAHVLSPVLWNCALQQRLDRGDRRRDVLIALSADINASLAIDAVIAAARKAIDALSDDAGCSIDLLEPGGATYRVYPSGGPLRPEYARHPEPLFRPLSGTPLQHVCETRGTFASDDLAARRRFEIDDELLRAGLRRYVVVPMIVRGRVIGALFMGATSPHPLRHMDLWLYENIAMQAGLAIENARQFRELQLASERLAQQNIYLREEIRDEHAFGEMIGASSSMLRLKQTIARVAPTDSSVLIMGETGVGKELVARAIHEAGRRAAQPLVKVNCAAIPEGMVESELFGHERGAFTSAFDRRIGRFELADRGTLFLDEVGELSLGVQAKLLRVLQDGEFERVGGTNTRRVDVRVVAATNRDLSAMIAARSFRSDLFYRLAVFPIDVPALAQRREDIPLLVEFFIAQFNRRMGKRVRRLSPESMAHLLGRAWPGNIRELRHVIERAMILCDGVELVISDAPDEPRSADPSPRGRPAVESLTENEAAHIRRALVLCNGRVAGPRGAAALLKINPSTLRSRMKRLGIALPSGPGLGSAEPGPDLIG